MGMKMGLEMVQGYIITYNVVGNDVYYRNESIKNAKMHQQTLVFGHIKWMNPIA